MNRGERDRLLPRDTSYGATENAGDNRSTAKGRAWGVPQEPPQETDQTKDLDNDQIQDMQRSKIREQDETIDIIGRSVARTKEIAHSIGNEIDAHVVLIDDIDGKTSKVDARLKNTTKRVERVQMKASAKIAWVIICILILGLIAVSILAWKM